VVIRYRCDPDLKICSYFLLSQGGEQLITLFRHSRGWEDRNDREKRILTENLSID
jgi:hypothetical protein